MASATTAAARPGTGRLLKGAGLLLLCILGLVAGLVVATGPRAALEMAGLAEASADPDDAAGAETAPAGHGPTGAVPTGGNFVTTPFKEIIVNISSTTATGRVTSRFLKLNLALVYDDRLPGAEQVEGRKLFMRDSFQDYLRLLNDADLQGSIGMVTLKAELLRRARAIADSEAPQEILISDLIVQ